MKFMAVGCELMANANLSAAKAAKNDEFYTELPEIQAELTHYKDKFAGKTVFYVGAGKEARKFADGMKKLGCVNFVDLAGVTTINQLARVLTMCQGLISVDTGTMHLACALDVPVAGIFYKTDTIERWAPRDFLYKSVVVDRDYSADYILQKFNTLL